MAETTGIVQSVSDAWRLLNQTGVMDSSRGLNTQYWQRNLREAVRELREAARALVRTDNREAYGELNDGIRQMLWKSILAASAPETGIYLISNLGTRYPQMPEHVRAADRAMAARANGFPVSVLHAMTTRILNAAPTLATAVEQEAARGGDPMPRRITREEGELYQRIVLRAIQRSRSEASAHRNAGEAALEAFSESFLPAVMPQDILADQAEGAGLAATLGEAGAERAGFVLSIVRAISAAADAHYRATNPEHRLNHWIQQGCLEASGQSQAAASQLLQRLRDIKQRMDAWLAWLQRHRDHPSYVPPYGRLDAAPTASLDTASTTQSSVGNRSGPVQGSARGASERGPMGMA